MSFFTNEVIYMPKKSKSGLFLKLYPPGREFRYEYNGLQFGSILIRLT
jgi:hypothetical protein